VTVAVQDSNGNTIFTGTGSTDFIQVSYSSPCSATPGSGNGANAVAGQITFTISDKVAESCTATFTDTSRSGVSTASTTVTFTGNGGATRLSGSFSPNPIPANGASQSVANICVTDAGGNKITTGTGSTDFISYNHTGNATNPLTSSPQQAVNGCATFTVQSTTTSGTDTYSFFDSSRTLTPGPGNIGNPLNATITTQ
jgi:hypothetical protein